MSSEIAALERIAAALERISPPGAALPDFAGASAYLWAAEPDRPRIELDYFERLLDRF